MKGGRSMKKEGEVHASLNRKGRHATTMLCNPQDLALAPQSTIIITISTQQIFFARTPHFVPLVASHMLWMNRCKEIVLDRGLPTGHVFSVHDEPSDLHCYHNAGRSSEQILQGAITAVSGNSRCPLGAFASNRVDLRSTVDTSAGLSSTILTCTAASVTYRPL